MEINENIIKRAFNFLGLVFIICGAILFFYPFLLIPSISLLGIIPQFIYSTLIISIGVTLNSI